VEITLANGDGLIKGGLFARVRFKNNSAPQVIVPETAIVGQGESPAIFVLSETQLASGKTSRSSRSSARRSSRNYHWT
jgi:multidrug efflux pump subunit AcrA (membrane-fusion protein)